MNLSEAVEAYQAILEGARAHPDDEALAEDLVKARREMEVAWLESTPSEPFILDDLISND